MSTNPPRALQTLSRTRVAALAADQLLRTPRVVGTPQGAHIELDGRPCISACSNDYLGLASHPTLTAAAVSALEASGCGASASRLISGTMTAHARAETRLSAFVRLPAARLFSTGYAANVGCLQALTQRGDFIFSDALNHASIIDGCRLSRATVKPYAHGDTEALGHLLGQTRVAHPDAHLWVVTDGLFSMDGDRAPLAELRRLCDLHGAFLYVDEAHSLGVLGPAGAGVCAEVGVLPDVLIGTLGKAFGCAGAFAATDSDTALWIYNRARSFVFSTAPPPMLAAVATAAADLVADADDRRALLRRHVERLRGSLRALGYDVPYRDAQKDSPILPVMVGAEQATLALAARLLERGVFVTPIRPPTVPPGTCRLRLVPTAAHTDADIEQIIAAFAGAANRRQTET